MSKRYIFFYSILFLYVRKYDSIILLSLIGFIVTCTFLAVSFYYFTRSYPLLCIEFFIALCGFIISMIFTILLFLFFITAVLWARAEETYFHSKSNKEGNGIGVL